MSEQAHYKITPEQGWNQMQAILDREMPTSRRTRRFVFFWWMFAALLFIGTTGFVAYQYSVSNTAHKPVQEINTAPVQPAKTQEIKASEPMALGETKAEAKVEAEAKAKEIKETKREERIFESGNGNKIEVAVANIIGQDERMSVEYTNDPVVALADPILTDGQQPVMEEDVINKVVELNHASSNTEANASIVSFSERSETITGPVPTLNPDYFLIPEEDIFSMTDGIAAVDFTRPAKNGLHVAPGIEVSTFAGKGGVGGYLGAALDARLSHRFDLNAGIGYRTFSPGIRLFEGKADLNTGSDPQDEFVKSDTLFDGLGAYVPSESVNNAAYTQLNPIIDYIDQWQAHLGLTYNFSKHFYVDCGVGFGFKTQAYSQYPIVTYDYVSSVPNYKTSNTLRQYEVIRSTLSSLYFGMGYHLGPHFDINLQWLHANEPYLLTTLEKNGSLQNISNKEREDYIGGLSLGVKYSIAP